MCRPFAKFTKGDAIHTKTVSRDALTARGLSGAERTVSVSTVHRDDVPPSSRKLNPQTARLWLQQKRKPSVTMQLRCGLPCDALL